MLCFRLWLYTFFLMALSCHDVCITVYSNVLYCICTCRCIYGWRCNPHSQRFWRRPWRSVWCDNVPSKLHALVSWAVSERMLWVSKPQVQRQIGSTIVVPVARQISWSICQGLTTTASASTTPCRTLDNAANYFMLRTPIKPELMTKTGISVALLDITLWTR